MCVLSCGGRPLRSSSERGFLRWTSGRLKSRSSRGRFPSGSPGRLKLGSSGRLKSRTSGGGFLSGSPGRHEGRTSGGGFSSMHRSSGRLERRNFDSGLSRRSRSTNRREGARSTYAYINQNNKGGTKSQRKLAGLSSQL
jgi:hypothetical protein